MRRDQKVKGHAKVQLIDARFHPPKGDFDAAMPTCSYRYLANLA